MTIGIIKGKITLRMEPRFVRYALHPVTYILRQEYHYLNISHVVGTWPPETYLDHTIISSGVRFVPYKGVRDVDIIAQLSSFHPVDVNNVPVAMNGHWHYYKGKIDLE
jgi:hypothetical protein